MGFRVDDVVDLALEASVVGSFTKIGHRLRSRIENWDDLPRLDGQVAVVTGGTSGLGRATAAGLVKLGAHVVITSRNRERAIAVAEELSEESYDASIGSAVGLELDTGDLDSIHRFMAEVREDVTGVDVLINNAGALTGDYRTDDRGMELTLSTHLVGPYLLTTELRDHLNAGARVLWMSSGGMYTQRLDVDALEMDESSYRGTIAYARAKRAQVEMVAHLAPEWAPEIVMHSVHPGWADTAGVDAGIPGFGKVMGPLLRTPEEGADTMIWLASTGGGDSKPGRFWLDRRARGISYVPGTASGPAERVRLVEWLNDAVALD